MTVAATAAAVRMCNDTIGFQWECPQRLQTSAFLCSKHPQNYRVQRDGAVMELIKSAMSQSVF